MANQSWQPIKTCPRNNMIIYYEPRDGKRCIGLAYLARDGNWHDSESNSGFKRISPTHWMPLPEPPVTRD